jgi:hypothetical protein
MNSMSFHGARTLVCVDSNAVGLLRGRTVERGCVTVVSEVAPFAFASSAVERVFVPKGIRVIRKHSFWKCESLRAVRFESGSQLQKVGSNSFAYSSLESIFIPRTVSVIENCSFACTPRLIEVTFESECLVEQFNEMLFFESQLCSLNVPRNVFRVHSSILRRLKNILIEPHNPHFAIESSVLYHSAKTTLLRNFARWDDVEILPTVETLAEFCFADCPTISSIIIGPSVRHIESFAFTQSSLQHIEIPRTVEVVGGGCFANCKSLVKVFFEEQSSLAVLPESCFEGTPLTSIKIPSKVRSIQSCCFKNCWLLRRVDFVADSEVVMLEAAVFEGCPIDHLSLPRGLRRIWSSALPNGCAFELPDDCEICGDSNPVEFFDEPTSSDSNSNWTIELDVGEEEDFGF